MIVTNDPLHSNVRKCKLGIKKMNIVNNYPRKFVLTSASCFRSSWLISSHNVDLKEAKC
jgi:hypothetical protein